MIPGQEQINIIFKGVKTTFRDVLLKGAPSDWQKIASVAPSTTRREYYPFLGDFPMIAELVGERVAKEVAVHGYSLENKTWEGTSYVDVPDIEDDTWGAGLDARTRSLAEAVKTFRDIQIFGSLVPLAFTAAGLCYDKTPMIGTTHPKYGGGYDVNLVVTEEETAAPWLLLDTSRLLMPFIWQERIAPQIVLQTQPNSEGVFWQDKIFFGSRERGNAGFAMWQQVVGSIAPLTEDNFNTAYELIQSRTHPDSGRKLGLKPTLLVVGPTNRNNANQVVQVERLANGASNPNWKIVEILNTSWME